MNSVEAGNVTGIGFGTNAPDSKISGYQSTRIQFVAPGTLNYRMNHLSGFHHLVATGGADIQVVDVPFPYAAGWGRSFLGLVLWTSANAGTIRFSAPASGINPILNPAVVLNGVTGPTNLDFPAVVGKPRRFFIYHMHNVNVQLTEIGDANALDHVEVTGLPNNDVVAVEQAADDFLLTIGNKNQPAAPESMICNQRVPGLHVVSNITAFGAGAISGLAAGVDTVNVGTDAGRNSGADDTTNVGSFAGTDSTGAECANLGSSAATTGQLDESCAIGRGAAMRGQQGQAVALGKEAAVWDQQSGALAIGFEAAHGAVGGVLRQGIDSICVGRRAGFPLGVAVTIPPGAILFGSDCAPPASGTNQICWNNVTVLSGAATAGVAAIPALALGYISMEYNGLAVKVPCFSP